jgi:hypothetical protein
LDKIQWEVIKVFMAGLVALAAGSFAHPTEGWIIGSLFATSVVGVLYVASFRAKRHHLHATLVQDSELAQFLRPDEKRNFHALFSSTWTLFVGTCALTDTVVFSYSSVVSNTGLQVGLGVALLLMFLCYRGGRSPRSSSSLDAPRTSSASAALMPEADAIALHLSLSTQREGTSYFSGFMHALAEARGATARDTSTGQKLPDSVGKHGSWLGAVGYFALLDQIGKCFKPRGAPRVRGNAIRQALKHFSSLRDQEIDALYALRCAFAHDYSLINVKPKQASLTHIFAVGQGAMPSVPSLPAKRWNGSLTGVDPSCQTVVSLEAFGDLVEDVVNQVRGAASRGDLEILLPGGSDELVRRYFFSARV